MSRSRKEDVVTSGGSAITGRMDELRGGSETDRWNSMRRGERQIHHQHTGTTAAAADHPSSFAISSPISLILSHNELPIKPPQPISCHISVSTSPALFFFPGGIILN